MSRYSEFGTIGICVDRFDKDVFEGRMYVSVYEKAREFKSLHGLIDEMNDAIVTAGVPHPFHEFRSFLKKKGLTSDKQNGTLEAHFNHERYAGERATFLVKILYRQNATWQGTVTWVENDSTENFRSALELFVLMESALQEK